MSRPSTLAHVSGEAVLAGVFVVWRQAAETAMAARALTPTTRRTLRPDTMLILDISGQRTALRCDEQASTLGRCCTAFAEIGRASCRERVVVREGDVTGKN